MGSVNTCDTVPNAVSGAAFDIVLGAAFGIVLNVFLDVPLAFFIAFHLPLSTGTEQQYNCHCEQSEAIQ
jgi:hypothetical protein